MTGKAKKKQTLFLLTRPRLPYFLAPTLNFFLSSKKKKDFFYKGLEIKRKSGRKKTVPFNPFCLHLTAKDCRKIIGEKYCDRLQLWRILVWQSSQSDSPCITTFQNGDLRAR